MAKAESISGSLWWRSWWSRWCFCSPWRLTLEQISTCSPQRTEQWNRWMCPDRRLEPILEQAPGRTYDPRVTSSSWSRFSVRTCGPVRSHTGTIHCWRTALCGKNPCWSSTGTVSYEKDLCSRILWITASPHWNEGRVWEVRSNNMWWIDLIPWTLVPLGGGEDRLTGSKVKPRKKEGVRERCSYICSCFSLSSSPINWQ